MGLRATKRRERDRLPEAGDMGGLLLCIDTSGARLNVSVSRQGELLAAYSALHPFSHATALLPVIDLLLEGQRATVAQLAGVGICVGPGSFTGLRVGMTTAKAIGASGNLPAAAVTSTVLLAAGSEASGLVAPLIDARRGEVYSSLYRLTPRATPSLSTVSAEPSGGEEEPVELLAPEAGSPESAIARVLDACQGPVTLVGSACPTCEVIFRDKGGDRIVFSPRSHCSISPEILARVCSGRLASGHTVDIRQLEPHYVGRPPIHGKQS